MKNIKGRRILMVAVALFTLAGSGCKKNPTASIYDPNYVPGAQPVIASIAPEGAPYPISGVTTLDLNGSNFTTDLSKIVVFFDAVPVQVLSATPTLVRVKTPNFFKDSVKVRISIVGVDKFSETKFVSIKPSILNADSIDFTKEEAWAVGADNNGNIFVSMTTTGGIGTGVFKFTSTGHRTQFALKGAETFFSSLKTGPGDTVFAARRVAAIYYLDPNVVAASKVYTTRAASPPMGNIDDFDFDPQKNLWGGGNLNPGIYRVNKFRQARLFPFANQVRAIRVFNNALYVAARVLSSSDTTEQVFQFPINAADTSLGAPVQYFNLTAQSGYQFNKITAITFDINGNLYVGTDGAAGILVVSAQSAAPTPLYGGLIGSGVLTFHWGSGTILYVIRATGSSTTPQVLLKVDMQVQSAPYYGRQ
jgi:hypothetical protein